MADSPQLKLRFEGTCPDCGVREVLLPPALPNVGDDFDWRVRDYDDFRMFMLEELAARFPERRRWSPADIEVVIVEVLATALDQMSDMLDRIAAEAFLETARRPATVRQLLEFIGYDPVAIAKSKDQITASIDSEDEISALEDFWSTNHFAMEQAKRAGPREIHTQKRMVTTEDYALRLREHPLIANAHAWTQWSGSWYTLQLAVIANTDQELDTESSSGVYNDDMKLKITSFHERTGISLPDLNTTPPPSLRMVIRPLVDAFRMANQEVVLRDPVFVGIYMAISIQVGPNSFQSEIRYAIAQVLGRGPGGLFEPGKYGFGEDIYASDIIEALMTLDGIENVCLNSLKRIGSQYLDRVHTGFIPLDGLEVAICNNRPDAAKEGFYRLKLHGGRKG